MLIDGTTNTNFLHRHKNRTSIKLLCHYHEIYARYVPIHARYVFIANKKRAHAQSFIAFPRLPYQLISILQEVNIKTMLKIALLLAAVPILHGSASCQFGDDYPSNPVGDITAYQEEPYSGNCNLDLKALKARSKGWTHFAALPKSTHYKGGKIQNSYSRYILVTAPPCHSQLSKL